ncbi:MAG: hypothetical protein V1792_06375 [Pseudomonadota bacterium]
MDTIEEIVCSLAQKQRSDLDPPLKDSAELEKLGRQYRGAFPADLASLYRITRGGFIQMDEFDSWRILSPKDIRNAPTDLKVDFVTAQRMPVVDCKDNDFICYDFGIRNYILMNIVDEIVFDEAESVVEFFNRKLDRT